MAELILIRGLPGSGKTTLAKKFVMMNYWHFEADIWRELFRNGKYNVEDNTEAHTWCLDRARGALLNHRNVVVANIFAEFWTLKPYIEMANDLGAKVTVIKCEGEYKNVHNVPVEKVEQHRKRWHNWPLI